MEFQTGSDPLIVRPGEGRRSGGTSGTGRVKVDLADSRSFAIVESAPPAGALGPPRHIHDEFDEAWYVLEGEMEFSIGDRVELCGSGSLAFAPRGVAHGFRNPGPHDARLLVVMTAECLQLVEEGGAAAAAGDRSALSEIFSRYRSRMAE
jgi:mannose-6-phosphate isomerase-like protein (cupin superfamily)